MAVRGVEALGSELIGKLSYHERWIVAFANILFEKEIRDNTGEKHSRKHFAAISQRAATIILFFVWS